MKNRVLLQLLMVLGLVSGSLFADYYDVVGVSSSASAADVNSTCKKQMLKYHPDKNPNNPDAEAKFKDINNACEVLRDPSKRTDYDKTLKLGASPSKTTSGGDTESTLAIEGKPEEPKGWLDKMKAKVQGLTKGKEEKISNFVGDQLAKIPIPSQSTVLFNQNITIKDLTFVKAPLSGDLKAGLGFTGTVQFNQFQIKGTIYAFLDEKDNKQVSVEMELPDQYALTDMFPSWKNSIISKLKLPKGRMVVSSVDYSSDDLDVKQGLNFAAIFDLSGPVEVLDTLRKEAVTVPGVIAEGGQATISGLIPQDLTKCQLKAKIPLRLGVDFTQISKVPKSVSKIFHKIQTTSFYVLALPAKQKLEVGGSIQLELGTQPAPLDFTLQGSIEKQLVTIECSMDGMLELDWAAIGDLGLKIDIDQSTLPAAALLGLPFTGIGLRGTLNLGKPGDKRAVLEGAALVSFKGTDIPDLLMVMKGSNIHLDDFVVFMSEVAAKQGLSKKSISPDKMPTIKIDKVDAYFAAADASIGTKEYKRGLSLEADANLFDHKMGMSFFLDPDKKNIRLSGKGYFDPIEIKSNGETIIKLSGSGCKTGGGSSDAACMEFDFQEQKPAEASLYITGKLEIPKLAISIGTTLDFDESQFKADFEAQLGGKDAFMVRFMIAIQEKKLDEFLAEFEFKADLGKVIKEQLLPAVRELKTTAVAKAEQADKDWQKANADWKKFNQEKGVVEKALEQHRAEVDKFKGQISSAQATVDKLQNAQTRAQWEQALKDIDECKRINDKYQAAHAKTSSINGWQHPLDYSKAAAEETAAAFEHVKCVKAAESAQAFILTAGLQGMTRASFDAANNVVEGYKQATKAVDAGRIALTEISNKVNQASTALAKAAPLKDTTAAVVGVLESFTEVLGQAFQIVNIKEAKGKVSGKELSAGKLPELSILEIDLAIPDKVPQIGGKHKTIILKDLQFDFKNPKTSLQSIAKSLAQTIKDMIAS